MPTAVTMFRALLLALCALGCDAEPTSNQRVPAPGDDWVASPTALTLVSSPESVVPEALRPALTALAQGPSVEIAAEDWEPGERAGSFSVIPALRLDLGVGVPWITLDGRVCRPVAGDAGREKNAELVTAFTDLTNRTTLRWRADTGRLVLRTMESELPRLVAMGYYLDDDSLLRQAERGLLAGPAGSPADLRGRVTLDHKSRRVLVAPAGTVLGAELSGDRISGLELVVGVAPLAFAADEHGRLRRADSSSDGVTFAVDLEQQGRITRLWSRHVRVDEGWVEDSLSVPSTDGRLLLVTEPGPSVDRAFDYGLWGRLRVTGTPRRAPARPHVVLIDVDTLRADRLGCYGHTRDTSPRIDAWAAERGTVFLDASAAGIWTLPSTVSMLTGLSSGQHGVIGFPHRLTPRLEPLAARLAAAGYETWGQADGGYLSAHFGFDEGFDVYDDQRLPWAEMERVGWSDVLARMAARRSERPLFVFLQTYLVHMPFREDRRFDDPAAPYAGPLLDMVLQKGPIDAARSSGELDMTPADWRWLNDLYDAGVCRMDDVVGAFLEGLDEALDGQPCLVILTSDHGEEISEHNGLGHGHSVHREVVAVPLIVSAPAGDWVGTSERSVSGLDLVPTVLAAAGLGLPEHLSGRDLLADPRGPRLVVSEHGSLAFSVRYDGWTLLRQEFDEVERLYDQRGDPDEQRDLASQDPERAARLLDMLKDWRDELPLRRSEGAAEQVVDAALVAELRSLGYLGGDEH
jgi:arylsulfatase A-like enzyme